MKALMGDSSDNIPGLPGVGPKTASAIISQFHSIENAHEHVDEIKPKKAQNAMRDHYDLAVLSKDLATIRCDAPVDVSFDELTLGEIYNEKSYEMFRRLNFKSLLGLFEADKSEYVIISSFNTIHLSLYFLKIQHSRQKQTQVLRLSGKYTD